MIAEAINRLSEILVRATAPVPLDLGDPRTKAYVIGGQVVKHDSEPSPRAHEVKHLADLIALANRFAADPTSGGPPVVWYDESAVVLVVDDAGHRLETATFRLTHTDVFARLVDLAKSKPKFDQKAFVRLLRIDLAGTLDPVVLLNAVRAVRWSSVTDVNVGKQRESLGRDIEARCVDGKDLPEEVTLKVPVFRQADERTPLSLRCSVEVDAGEGTFRLLPLPDEIDRVLQVAVASIAERLTGQLDGATAYYGKP
jgi:hypothetical protein